VLQALRNTDARFKDFLINRLKGDIAAPVTNWKKALFYAQVSAQDLASAQAFASLLVNGVPITNAIVTKAQTEESVLTLKHYLSFLPAGAVGVSWDNVRLAPAAILKDPGHAGGQARHDRNDFNAAALKIFEQKASAISVLRGELASHAF
jgi:hypothetical protein